ncbi:hypothetical protein AN958_02875 [Leucoagaricus sp. SymC.cos]|nr:hypothetical protein AN958_02875 [Leucoagaricus sp. SymC.cos]
MDNICSQCGLNPKSTAPIPPAPTQSPHEEIDFIKQEFSRIDDHIRRLCEEKASLGRRLNELQATTKILPPETISLIFRHVCRSSWNATNAVASVGYQRQINILPLLRLGGICSLWRQIAWSTPDLWSTALVDVHANKAERIASLLELCFRNVGIVPVSLYLRFFEEELLSWGKNPTLVFPIANLVFKKPGNAEKIRVLRLHDSPIAWMNLLSEEKLKNLEVLTLAGFTSKANWTSITLPKLPSLRCFTISDMWHHITLPSADTITTLQLSRTCVDICIGVLRQCVNVVECQFDADDNTRDEGDAARNILDSPITFPHLRDLTWPVTHGRSNVLLFHFIQLPVLKRLRLSSPVIRGTIPSVLINALKEFFDHSSSTLQILELTQWSCSRENMLQLSLSLPGSIRELLLINCFETFASHLLQGLNPPPGQVKNLPVLELLHISSINKTAMQLLKEVLEKREDGIGAPFKIVLPSPGVILNQGVRQLQAFARDRSRQIEIELL